MATINELLKGVTLYPVPSRTLEGIAARRGVALSGSATQEILGGAAFNLAKADLLMWLSRAPNVAQGGQTYSFSDEQRQQFRTQAKALMQEYADDSVNAKPIYGYKGCRL